MAITNTRTVERIEVYPGQGENDPRLMVVYEHLFDDTEDDQLPITTTKVVYLESTFQADNGDGTFTTTATDVTSHDQLVQDVCTAVWAE